MFWDKGLGNGVLSYKGSTGGYLTFTVPLGSDTDALVAGRSYVFVISAVNGVGEGAQSDPLSVIAATKPVKPPSPQLVYQSPSQITLSWDASSDGGSVITDYIVLSDLAGVSFTALAPTTGSKLIRTYDITSTNHLI